MEGRRTVTFRNGGNNGGSGVRGPMSAERARLQAFATEFQALLAEAVKSVSVQGTPIPEPKHFWLVPILHRLASIAEVLEASYCRQPGVDAFDNRRYMHPIGVAIRLATLGSVENDRYSQPTRFITDVLFGLLRSGGGVGGGALVLAAVCRFLCAVSMATADQGSRTAPPPPISTLLSDDLELYEVVLSWARGETPPSIGGGNGFDGAAARAAMDKGLDVVRALKAAAHRGLEEGRSNDGEEKQTDVKSASTAPAAGAGAGAGGSSEMSEEGERAIAGAGGDGGSGAGELESEEVRGVTASASAAGAPTVGRSSPPPPPSLPPAASATAAAPAPAVEELAGAELRAHATGLVAAGLLSRQASDLIVNKGFAGHLVQRLREGAVAEHLRDEAASEQERLSPSGETGRPGEDSGGSVGGGSAGAGAGGAGRAAGVGVRGAVADSSAAAFSGSNDGAATWSAVMSARACPSTLDNRSPKYGRWTGVAAVEAEHVAACISAIGGYQEILAPLFSGDGLAVVDLLLANPQLEVRVHAVELLSALLVHKKVGLAFVRRGWVRTVLRLGALENGSFLEPEIGFCLHGLAASGGVMEAVCRVQDDTLERLMAYAASLLRSPSESTQRNAMLFWEAAMRFPPALEAFDRHGGVSKLLYLLLPTAQGYSDAASSGASAAGRTGGSGAGTRSSGAGTRNNGDSSPPRQRSRWWQIGSSAVPNGGGGGGGGGGGTGAGSETLRGGREQGSLYTSASAVQHRRSQVTLGACSCVRQYLRCSLALAVLKQQQRAGGDGGGGGSASRQEQQQQQQQQQQQGRGQPQHTGRSAGTGSGGNSLVPSSSAASAAATTPSGAAAPSTSPRTPGRPAWQCKPLSVDDASHAAHVIAVKGKLGVTGRTTTAGLAGRGGALGVGWVGVGAAAGGVGGRDRGGGTTVRLGMHWPPAVQLMHHRGMQALINVVDTMLSQRTMGAETAIHALDALATAALCPLVYPELCRPGSNNPTGGGGSGGAGGPAASHSTPSASQPPPSGGAGTSSASAGSGSASAVGGGGGGGGSPSPWGRSRSSRLGGGEGGSGAGEGGGGGGVSGGVGGGGAGGAGTLSRNRLGVDVLLDAAGGVRQKDPGVMCAALKVLETCCRPHKGCGPLIQPVASAAGGAAAPSNAAAAAAGGSSTSRHPPGGQGYSSSPSVAGVGSAAVAAPAAASATAAGAAAATATAGGGAAGGGGGLRGDGGGGGAGGRGAGLKRSASLDPAATMYGRDPGMGSAAGAAGGVDGDARVGASGGGGGGGGGTGSGVSGERVVDDRLQRPMRKLVRERNGIRVLVGLLRYRRQVAAADSVRLRAALCLLGLAHDVQIAQVLEKMRITTTLSDTVRAGPVVNRNVESYSQLREAAKQIIARVAGRLSGTVGRSGLMDPAVTGLERAAVVANTPITFRPRELLGIIHEYLAANGLAGSAEALASEAGIAPDHPNPRTPGRRGGQLLLGANAGDGGGGGPSAPALLPPPSSLSRSGSASGRFSSTSSSTTSSASRRGDASGRSGGAAGAGAEGVGYGSARGIGGVARGATSSSSSAAAASSSACVGDKRTARGGKRLSFSAAGGAGAGRPGGSSSGGGGSKRRGGLAPSATRTAPRPRSSEHAPGGEEGDRERGEAGAKRPRLEKAGVVNRDDAGQLAGRLTGPDVGDGGDGSCRIDGARAVGDGQQAASREKTEDATAAQQVSGESRPAPRAPAIATVPLGRAGRISAAFASPSYFGSGGVGGGLSRSSLPSSSSSRFSGGGKGRPAGGTTGTSGGGGGGSKSHRHGGAGGRGGRDVPGASPRGTQRGGGGGTVPRASGTSGKTTKEEGRGSGGRGTGGSGAASGGRARSKLERSSSTPSRLTGPSPSSVGGSSTPSASAASRGKRSARAAAASSSGVAGAADGSGASDVAEVRPAANLKPLVSTAGDGGRGGIDDNEDEEDRWAASPIGTPRGFYTSVASSAGASSPAGGFAGGATGDASAFGFLGGRGQAAAAGGGRGGEGAAAAAAAGARSNRMHATATGQLQVAARSSSHHHTHAQGGGIPGCAGGLDRGSPAIFGGGGGGGRAVTGTTALDKIVTSFLRNQHERCPDPICVLPPLSLSEPHRCPDRTPAGALGSGAPPNVAKRVLAWQAVPPLGGRGGARLQRAFVHSRFRRHRSIQDPDHLITASAFARRPGGGASRLWVGTDAGVVRLWETFSMGIEGRWRVSQHPVTSIEQHPGDRVGRSHQSPASSAAGGVSSPLLLTSVGFGSDSEALLWRALGGADTQSEDANEQEEQPLFRWHGLRAARFDHGGTRAAAVISPHAAGLNAMGGGGEGQLLDQAWGAQVMDVETGSLLARLWDARSRPLYPLPNVDFNATDDLVVTDGALWDPRRGLRVYQFDKLGGGSGFGLFHPNGNEVVVDEGVWDLRTHRLLRTLPCQDGTVMKPDPGGEVFYTYRPAPAGDFYDMPQKRAAQDTCFGVLDSSTYEQIHSHDTEKAIIQLSTDDGGSDGSYISVVERADPLLNSVDTVCSLYEIGRKRPDEADSDMDDAMSEDSDEEWEDADHSDGDGGHNEDGISGWASAGHSSQDSDDDDIIIDTSGSDRDGDDSQDEVFGGMFGSRNRGGGGGGGGYDYESGSSGSSSDGWVSRQPQAIRRRQRRDMLAGMLFSDGSDSDDSDSGSGLDSGEDDSEDSEDSVDSDDSEEESDSEEEDEQGEG